MLEHSKKTLDDLIDYMYDHVESLRMILSGSSGSRYENWLDSLILVEEENMRYFITSLRCDGCSAAEISDELIHIQCGSFFSLHDGNDYPYHVSDNREEEYQSSLEFFRRRMVLDSRRLRVG